MIAANKLRIGNWVNLTKGSGVINTVNINVENIILEYDNYIDGNRTYIQQPTFHSNLEIKSIIIESGEYAGYELEFSTKSKDGFILIYDIQHSSDMSDFTRAHDIIKEGSILRFMLEKLETEYFSFNGNFDLVDMFSPIPLTEEILLKCGFEKAGIYYCMGGNEDGGIVLKLNDSMYYPIITSFGIPIKYLHQLQNLHFALTGKELEVKI